MSFCLDRNTVKGHIACITYNKKQRNNNNKKVSLTIEELRALGIALLHLFTFISCCLHVAVSHSKHCCTRLHQELAHLHIVAGCSTVKRCPMLRGWVRKEKEEEERAEEKELRSMKRNINHYRVRIQSKTLKYSI